jgi:hypothetical protein
MMSTVVRAGDAPHPDPLWREVLDFVSARHAPAQSVIAPKEFGEHLVGAIPYEDSDQRGVTAIDCVVIHKGWVEQLSHPFLKSMIAELSPAFANAVFVVYASGVAFPVEKQHVDAFLAVLPDHVRDGRDPGAAHRSMPLMVYLGDGRMLCRDPEYRKLVLPAKPSTLLAMIADGGNVVATIASGIVGPAASARRVVDLGAGCGLFLLAAHKMLASDARFLAVESSGPLMDCVRFNVDLGGLFWRTEFQERIDSARDREFFGRGKDGSWDPDTDCDLVHLDLAYEQAPRGADLENFLKARTLPHVVLSHGLSTRMAPDAKALFDSAAMTLRALGYSVPEARGFGMPGQPVGEDVVACARPAD